MPHVRDLATPKPNTLNNLDFLLNLRPREKVCKKRKNPLASHAPLA